MQIDPRCEKRGDHVCCGGTCKKPTELAKLRIDEVSLVGDPSNYHSRVVLMKAHKDDDEPAHEGDENKPVKKEENTVQETIKKYLDIEATLRAAEQSGEIQKANISKSSAESGLDELAQALMVEDRSLSAEQAFFKSMELAPTLGHIAVGQTTGN